LSPGDEEAAQAFYEDALARGHEGVMAKALEARTRPEAAAPAGSRSKRRTRSTSPSSRPNGQRPPQGLLSNLHLAAPDPATGGFVMLARPSRA